MSDLQGGNNAANLSLSENDSTDAAVQPAERLGHRIATRPAGAPPEIPPATDIPSTGVAEPSQQPYAGEFDLPAARVRATRDAFEPPHVEPGPSILFPAAHSEDQRSEDREDEPRRRSRRRSRRTEDEAPEQRTEAAQDEERSPRRRRSRDGEQDGSRRRRRGESRDEQPVETTSSDEAEEADGIAAALRLAEEQVQSRRGVLSDPFAITSENRQEVLDRLATSIANGDDEDDSDDEDAETDDEAPESSEDSDEERPRRRRRRGGRRRRRGGSDSDENTSEEETQDSEDDEDSEEDSEASDDAEAGVTRRRRRRRRRSGTSASTDEGDDEIHGIEGSTRMEAKRQRRKENRAAGRRRAPILSEAEFLARRESVEREMVIRQKEDYTQVAVMEDGILVEHYVDRAESTSLIGNVYLGKVQNVLPSMEAAFVDIGRGRNAVLYAGEVDWDSFGVTAEDRKVETVFKSGQSVLVQVTKDPVGAKGARLTGHISLPGRYVVYSPGGHLSGISRKLPDGERSRLRQILGDLISDDESVIVRTAAEGVSSEELVRDVNRLKAQWEVIEKKIKQGKAPQALYTEPDPTLRIVRDLFNEDFKRLVVQGNGGQDDMWDAVSAYVGHVAPHLEDRLEKFEAADDETDVFTKYKVDEHIAKALDRKVYLPSGGSLVIDRTEAMTVIDVNTGRFTGSGGNLEATVTSNNLEAAEEIVRQLRLRDLGGIIVIDFIDMVLPSNRELLLRRLVECLGRDRTRHQVAEVTSLGLVQLTRKRIGTGLQEAFTEECECCNGSGLHRSTEPVETQAPADGGDRRPRGGRRRRNDKAEKADK